MTPPRQPRTSGTGVLLLVLFAGFEAVQAVSRADATLLLGTWLALTAAAVLALRLPSTRAALRRRNVLRAAVLGAEASWVALAVTAALLVMLTGRASLWVWALAALAGVVLTPLTVPTGS
ncbi:MAG: hypothetical protein ACYDAC_08680 [Candidatus Dormibacteria bacterium]